MKNIDKEILIRAIHEYRETGKQLMFQLGWKFELDLAKPEECMELLSRKDRIIPRKGEMTKRWNYAFHGYECGFYNKKHQQSVEVVLTNAPEFGHLDAWFVMQFMESTKAYKDAVKDIDYRDLKIAITELYKTGEIENIKNGWGS
jgi:hypothetical protein